MSIFDIINPGPDAFSADRKLVSSKEINEAIREGEKRLHNEHASIAINFLHRKNSEYSQYSQEDLIKGCDKAIELASQMKEKIKQKIIDAGVKSSKPTDVLKSLDALQRKGIIAPKEIEALLSEMVASNLGNAKSDEVASNLIKLFIKGIDESLKGINSPSQGAHR